MYLIKALNQIQFISKELFLSKLQVSFCCFLIVKHPRNFLLTLASNIKCFSETLLEKVFSGLLINWALRIFATLSPISLFLKSTLYVLTCPSHFQVWKVSRSTQKIWPTIFDLVTPANGNKDQLWCNNIFQ